MGENSTTTQHDSPSRLAKGLSPAMIATLRHGATRLYGRDTVYGNTNTLAALVTRGLVTPGKVNYLTDLGRRVAYAAGINILLIDELHAEALAEDAERFPYSGNEGDLTREQAATVRIERSQIEKWLAGHGVTILTAGNILAARDADHAEALTEDLARFPYSGNEDYLTREQAECVPRTTPAADIDEAIERLIRAAKSRALSEVLKMLDSWIEQGRENNRALDYRDEDRPSGVTVFHPDDLRNIVNAAADALGIGKP